VAEAYPLTLHRQYDGIDPVVAFCDTLETRNGTGPAYSEGLVAHFNVTIVLDAFLTGIAETNPETFAVAGPPATDEADELSWQYQYCTEFGMFPVS